MHIFSRCICNYKQKSKTKITEAVSQRRSSVQFYLWLCSFCPLNLGPAHRDSKTLGFASVRRWPVMWINKWTFMKPMQKNEWKEREKKEKVPTCTILLMTCGSMLRGNLRMLKSDSDTKAFSASRTLFSSTVTYTANVVRATWKHIDKHASHTSIGLLYEQQCCDAAHYCLSQAVTQQCPHCQQVVIFMVFIITQIHIWPVRLTNKA